MSTAIRPLTRQTWRKQRLTKRTFGVLRGAPCSIEALEWEAQAMTDYCTRRDKQIEACSRLEAAVEAKHVADVEEEEKAWKKAKAIAYKAVVDDDDLWLKIAKQCGMDTETNETKSTIEIEDTTDDDSVVDLT